MGFSKSEENNIKTILGTDMLRMVENSGDLYLIVKTSSIVRVATILYTNITLEFKMLLDAFAVDMTKQINKFEIYYQLYSNKLKRYIFIVIAIEEYENVPSLSIVFKNISWYEREIFDMFGIIFTNHSDLRRILSKSDTNGFLLKK